MGNGLGEISHVFMIEQHPQGLRILDSQISQTNKPIIHPSLSPPEILGMLKHMGSETSEALSDGQVAEVQAQKVTDLREWMDLDFLELVCQKVPVQYSSVEYISPVQKKLVTGNWNGGSSVIFAPGVSRPFRCKGQRNQSSWA